jgi:integrase
MVPVRKKPVRIENLKEMLGRMLDSVLGKRDRALLLLGFTGAFRRSELAALNVEDLEETREGLVAMVRRSKTDPEEEGRKVGIPEAPSRPRAQSGRSRSGARRHASPPGRCSA